MIEVKVFKENTGSELEWDVNNFFKHNPDIELVDVKLQVAAAYVALEIKERYTAMVIYKKAENK